MTFFFMLNPKFFDGGYAGPIRTGGYPKKKKKKVIPAKQEAYTEELKKSINTLTAIEKAQETAKTLKNGKIKKKQYQNLLDQKLLILRQQYLTQMMMVERMIEEEDVLIMLLLLE